jgi:hypothetical protein
MIGVDWVCQQLPLLKQLTYFTVVFGLVMWQQLERALKLLLGTGESLITA